MTIVREIGRPPDELLGGFRELLGCESPTCAVSDAMGRFNAMDSRMKPLFDGIRFVGTAVTAKTLASDLAAVFKAIDLSMPGDVIVVDSRGSVDTAFWGENMSLSALNKGVVGAVIDGSCRDVEEIRRIGFPVISKGIVPNVGSISGHGQVNVSVQCAGVAVSPGDILIVDGNGVVVVPKEHCANILDATRRLLRTERGLQEKIKAGATIGELVNIDEVLSSTFDYQERATEHRREQ